MQTNKPLVKLQRPGLHTDLLNAVFQKTCYYGKAVFFNVYHRKKS